MRLGLHTSIAKSLENAAIKAAEVGANTFQIFSASPRMWRASPPAPSAVKLLQRARERHDLTPLVIHDNYLINLASCSEPLRLQSTAAFRGEIERALAIGAEYLVAHPGNCKGHSVEQGIYAVIRSLAEAAQGLDTTNLTVLLENTAGSGAALGSRFEELGVMRQFAAELTDLKIGFCIDTCHCLASGYDVSQRGRIEADGGRDGSRAGHRQCAGDPRQRFQNAAWIARGPARTYRTRLYWRGRVSPHPQPPEAPHQGLYSRDAGR